MKDKKNIDKVFKDGLKNLEASPSPRVWENIQAELNKEKSSRKVIPLWIRIGGVAALIALLLSVGNWVYDPLDFDSPAITNENTNQTEKEALEKTRGDQQSDEIRIASEDKSVSNEEVSSEEDIHNKKSEHNNRTDSFDQEKIVSPKKSVETAVVPEKIKSDTEDKSKENFNKIDNQQEQIETSIASEKIKSDTEDKSKENFGKIDSQKEGIATSKIPSKAISNDKIENDSSSDGIITDGNIKDKTSLESKNEDAIAKENSDKIKLEEALDSQEKPSLLEAIAEQENLKDKKDQKEALERRWKVTPNLAPVYYSSLGNGSSIDPEFSDNPQKGDVNMSYGVQVSYALNDKLSLRTGLNNVDLSYSTSDIVIATGPVGLGLRGVDYGSKEMVVTAINRATLNNSTSSDFGVLNLKSTSGDARLIQNINYYEVPLELQYSVIDSRFGVNVIGGVSTLFLGNNEISVKDDNFSSVLGSANNLSSVSFSTNVGLGLNYKLSKKFIFNIEPMFKYQLNPYSDSSVDFKPYYLGIYSGLSFKF